MSDNDDYDNNWAGEELVILAELAKRCEICEEVVDQLVGDRTPAYRLGNYLISQGDERVAYFQGNRQLMTQCVDSALDEAVMECDCERRFERF